ncbi:MAG: hypothetical protein H0V82_07835 [Candidatus Protochlamydia sp.]|nr:hypothetical protein [Candidatus Protochlamydia sp.]
MNVSNTVSTLPSFPQHILKLTGNIILKICSIALPIIGGLSVAILIIKLMERSHAVIPTPNPLITGFEEIKIAALRILENNFAQSISAKVILKIKDNENFDYENSFIIHVGEELSSHSISRAMDNLFRVRTIPPEANAHSFYLQYSAVIILKKADLTTFSWAEVSKRVNLLGTPSHLYFNALEPSPALQNLVIEATGIRNAPFFDDLGNLI